MKMNREDYRHSITRQVYLYETDAFGHTNNVTFFQYMESARFELFKAMGLFDPKEILSLGLVLAHAECDYRKISRYDDTLRIYSRVTKIGNSSFSIEHLITHEETGELMATGRVVLVSFNHKTNKTQPLTRKVKGILESYR